MSNITPQHPSLNRGMWKRVENYARLIVLASDSTYIIAGGILSDNLNTLDNTDICIPEFFFKVIYRFTDGKMTTYCFLMANKKLEGDITDYLVPLEAIEKLANLKFSIKIK